MTTTIGQQVRLAQDKGVPLLAIHTPDQPQTVSLIQEACADRPVYLWDVLEGLQPLNAAAKNALPEWAAAAACQNLTEATKRAPDALLMLAKHATQDTLLLMANAPRFLTDVCVMQGAANLRDVFKLNFRTLVLLGKRVTLPDELQGDVLSYDEPYPTSQELQETLRRNLAANQETLKFKPTERLVETAAESMRGLSAFAAEQISALALEKTQLNMDTLRLQAYQMIEQTPGLSVDRWPLTFADVRGLDFLQQFSEQLFTGPEPPAVVVRIEELEKSMQGATGGDLSGTSGDALPSTARA